MKSLVIPRPKQKVNFITTMQTPYENLQGSPTALPTSKPASPQCSWTIVSGDLPVFTPAIISCIYVCVYITSGQNTSGTTAYTLSYQVNKNGTSAATGSLSIPASNYWTANAFFNPVAVGNTLDFYIWAGDAAVVWDYEARQIQPSRVKLNIKTGTMLKNLTLTNSPQPVLTLGTPGVVSTQGLTIFPFSTANVSISSTSTVTLDVSSVNSNYIDRLGAGDLTSGLGVSKHATNHPYYYRNFVPNPITYRNIGVIH